jgi:hypothetical protein
MEVTYSIGGHPRLIDSVYNLCNKRPDFITRNNNILYIYDALKEVGRMVSVIIIIIIIIIIITFLKLLCL